MGHSSPRAALIYLHSIDEGQREIADAMSDLAAQELERRTARRPSATATGTAAERRSVVINTTSCPTVPELVYSVSGAKGTRTPACKVRARCPARSVTCEYMVNQSTRVQPDPGSLVSGMGVRQ